MLECVSGRSDEPGSPNCLIMFTTSEYYWQDLQKKEGDYKKSENTARSEFNALCKQLGIRGHQIKHELAEKLKELPVIYEKIAEKAKLAKGAVEFYCGFVNYTLGRQHDSGCVSMAKYVIGM